MHSHPRTASDLFNSLIGRQHFQDLLTATTTGKEQFLVEFMPVAERFAMCVQDLPLAPDVFKAQGGALQAGLQSGLLAVRTCDAMIFQPKATAQERQRNDPLFRWCAYCSTLASVFLICAGQVEVVLADGEVFTFAGREPLFNAQGSFSVKWREGPSKPTEAGLLYLQTVFYPGQFAHLSPEMLALLGGSINPALATLPNETPLGRVVRTSITQVIEAQRRRDASVMLAGTPAQMLDLPASTAAQQADPVQPPSSAVATEAAKPKPEPAAIPTKLLDWVRALANIRSMDDEISISDRGIRLGRKALGFGATPKENYTALYEAKVVLDKGADFALCNRALASAYTDAKDKAIGGKA